MQDADLNVDGFREVTVNADAHDMASHDAKDSIMENGGDMPVAKLLANVIPFYRVKSLGKVNKAAVDRKYVGGGEVAQNGDSCCAF